MASGLEEVYGVMGSWLGLGPGPAGNGLLAPSPGDSPAPMGQDMEKTMVSLLVVGVAMVLSHVNHLGLAKDMAVSIARAFLQLFIMGFVLSLIFSQEGWRGYLLIFGAFCFMVFMAGVTAGQRAKGVPRASHIVCAAVFLGAAGCTGLLLLLRVFEPIPRFLIPITGMMVGNAMTNCAVALKRLREDLKQSVPLIEVALALGATPRQAIQPQIRRCLTLALVPVLDNLKTLGLISLPGAMTGMIMGGASPVEATRLQMIVATFLVGCSTISCLLCVLMAWPCFFTPTYQIIYENLS